MNSLIEKKIVQVSCWSVGVAAKWRFLSIFRLVRLCFALLSLAAALHCPAAAALLPLLLPLQALLARLSRSRTPPSEINAEINALRLQVNFFLEESFSVKQKKNVGTSLKVNYWVVLFFKICFILSSETKGNAIYHLREVTIVVVKHFLPCRLLLRLRCHLTRFLVYCIRNRVLFSKKMYLNCQNSKFVELISSFSQ